MTDRDTSEIAAAAWWEPSDVVGNSAVRVEVQSSDWAALGAVKAVKADPKGNAQATGQTTHSIDAYRDAIVAHYAPLLTAALKHSTKGLHQAIDEAQRKTAAKAVAGGLEFAVVDDVVVVKIADGVVFELGDAPLEGRDHAIDTGHRLEQP